MKRNKSAKTLSQSRQDFIIDRCLMFLVSALQIDRNLARFRSRREFLRTTERAKMEKL